MAHQWKFVRAGGFDQVKLTSGADLAALDQLDQKLWVALACPTKGLEFDERTLALIDTDGDDRILATELIEAASWAKRMLVDVDVLSDGRAELPLAQINDSHDDGAALREAANRVLVEIGKPDDDRIGVDDATAAMDRFIATPFNGDGVIVDDSAGDDATRQIIVDVRSVAEAPPTDRSGAAGVDQATLDAVFAELDARVAWLDAGAQDGVQPLGDDTEAAFGALQAVRAKVDDFFARCRVAAFDPRALEAVNRQESEYLTIAAEDLAITADEVSHFPIAMVEPGKALPLTDGLNPAWESEIAALRSKVVAPLLGDEVVTLDEAAWTDLCGRFSAHEAWLAAMAGASVAELGEDRVRELQGGSAKATLEGLIQRDNDAAPIAAAIESVERLVRYVRDLLDLANNFVAFRDFYARTGLATFQVGTLYIDQRSCELCVRVNDAAKHAKLAPLSEAYLLYCVCKNAQGQTMNIAAAMTDGDVDNLMAGRNGVFYDRDGNDWDATVTRVVKAPISIRQAFWTPYKRFMRAIEDFIASRAADAEASSMSKVDAASAAAGKAATGGAKPEAKSQTLDVGMIAALGVAAGGITAALGLLLQSFFGLGIWMPLGVVGLVLLISGPSMVIAWLKLRRRNLGPLLDANGWAVNAQARINVPLGASLTQVATLPAGSSRDLRDPYAERGQPWGLYLTGLIVLALAFGWYTGNLDDYLPPPAKSTTVLGELAPAGAANDEAPAEEAPPAEPAPADSPE